MLLYMKKNPKSNEHLKPDTIFTDQICDEELSMVFACQVLQLSCAASLLPAAPSVAALLESLLSNL